MEKRIKERLSKYYNTDKIKVIKLNNFDYELECLLNKYNIRVQYIYNISRSFDYNISQMVKTINLKIIEIFRKG